MTSDAVSPAMLDYTSKSFSSQLESLLAWESSSEEQVNQQVKEIIDQVRQHQDQALVEYTCHFDRRRLTNMSALVLDPPRLQQALDNIPPEQLNALKVAADRIREYHLRQHSGSWQYQEDSGTLLGQRITPIDRVGIYVPGGRASYPSSVLMNAIPAQVAGVPEVFMAVPAPDNELNEMVLAAAALSGVDRVFTIGGAQAVAALAYGTETVPKVDKITGPGNVYVAAAKKAVYGQVGIDMIAGPSEILVVCDGQSNPDWIAMDLFSQAEHDDDAQAILISPDEDFLRRVKESINRLLPTMERQDIIATSLSQRGALILVPDMESACDLVNSIAPEHLELAIDQPEDWLPKIRHAGAIFMGRYTSESLGDYCAGPNHVLPTSGTARFSSPLGVYDFQKRTSLVQFSAEGASEMGKVASVLARSESLTAHARSAEYRIKD